jgi:hypothetical protein
LTVCIGLRRLKSGVIGCEENTGPVCMTLATIATTTSAIASGVSDCHTGNQVSRIQAIRPGPIVGLLPARLSVLRVAWPIEVSTQSAVIAMVTAKADITATPTASALLATSPRLRASSSR